MSTVESQASTCVIFGSSRSILQVRIPYVCQEVDHRAGPVDGDAISRSIDSAINTLRKGGVIGAPTDTLYGILADATNEAAVAKVFEVKERLGSSPLPVFVAHVSDLHRYGREIPELACALADRFWPGKLTIVVKKSDLIPSLVSGGLDTVGIRIPDHPVPRSIVAGLGVPVTATSANVSGMPPMTSAEDVARVLGERLDLVYDGGQVIPSQPSTVIDVTVQPPRILRAGAVTRTAIEQVTGVALGM